MIITIIITAGNSFIYFGPENGPGDAAGRAFVSRAGQ